MKFISKFYVKINKQDLLDKKINNQVSPAVESLLSAIESYERESFELVDCFYLSVVSKYYNKLLDVFYLTIEKQSITNAFLYALCMSESEKALKLAPFISQNEVDYKDLGPLLNYVLDHSLDFDELLDGEQEKLIFDDETDSFKKGFIHNGFNNQKKLV